MEYRQLGRSGLRVSALTLGTMTFGGRGIFANVGTTDVKLARRQVDQCIDAGVNLVDTADVYSDGLAEEILGEVLAGRGDRVLVSTKARFPTGAGPNDAGLSRHHLIASCEASLRRLRTDHIDVYYAHEWDGLTPVEETLEALDTLVQSGKVRYLGCSNSPAGKPAKSLMTADRLGYQRYVSSQIHYSLQARDAEYELLPAAIHQVSGSSSGVHSRAAYFGQVPPRPGGPRRGAADQRVARAAGARPGAAPMTSSKRLSRSDTSTPSRRRRWRSRGG